MDATLEKHAAGRILDALLLAVVIVPALAFCWGREAGRVAFVLYREPKLIATAVLGWVLVSALLWRWRSEPALPELLRMTLRRPEVVALGAWLSYLATTGVWVRVPENYLYELNQYVLLGALLLALLVWTGRDGSVAGRVHSGVVASLAVVTGVGLVQAVVPIAVLVPIDPQMGVANPSLLGYKNPAALALLGQLFLLAQLVFNPARTSSRRRRFGLGLLLLAELAYLVSLGSRTSYAALAVAALFFVCLRLARRPSRRRTLRTAAAAAGLLLAFSVAVATDSLGRQKLTSLVSYLSSPSSYLESDRGTYFRNTLNMARHHPFGVGLGDWQTHYPVYRLHNRYLAFSDQFQVRRAHSDHVQILGEAGWPGLVLWGSFLLILIGATAREHLRTGHAAPLYASAQLVAFAAAMATDYLLELPYNKLQFFLVVFLALAARHPAADRQGGAAVASRRTRQGVTLAAVALVSVTAVQVAYHASLARKIHLAAAMERTYLRAIEDPAPQAPAAAAPFVRVLGQGHRFAALAGHTKTFHKDYLLLAHSAHLLGQRAEARAAAEKALALHPYSTSAFRLLAEQADDPHSAASWQRAYDDVMNRATRGFEGPYPKLPP